MVTIARARIAFLVLLAAVGGTAFGIIVSQPIDTTMQLRPCADHAAVTPGATCYWDNGEGDASFVLIDGIQFSPVVNND